MHSGIFIVNFEHISYIAQREIRWNAGFLWSLFSRLWNTGKYVYDSVHIKYRSEKAHIWAYFTQCCSGVCIADFDR